MTTFFCTVPYTVRKRPPHWTKLNILKYNTILIYLTEVLLFGNTLFNMTIDTLKLNALVDYIHTYIHAYIHTYIHTYPHTYIHTYMHACMHACMHIYIYIYIHKCLYAWKYILIYKHTYKHFYMVTLVSPITVT